MKTIRVRLTFVEDLLGASPNNEEIYTEFIGSKSPDALSLEEEVAALGDDVVAEKGTTVFPRDTDGNPIFWSYQIQGFFKGSCSDLKRVPGTLSSKLKAFKKVIDGTIFVFGEISEDNKTGRKIRINDAFPIDLFQRPLRAATMQGDRVTLACSERIKAGAWTEFNIKLLNDSDEDLIREWLDYGMLKGISQFRNGGFGRFTYEVLS